MSRIESYGFGSIKMEGKRYCLRDVVLYPDETIGRRKFGRWVRSHHKLVREDMCDVVEGGAESIIIGTGRFSGLKVSDGLRNYIREVGGKLIELPSAEAVKEYNNLVDEGNNKVGAFFHLMC